MLTSALRTLVKDSNETIDKFYVEKDVFFKFQYVEYTISKKK